MSRPKKVKPDINLEEEHKKRNFFVASLLGLYGVTGALLSIVGFKAPFADDLAKHYWRQALAGLFIVLFMLAGLVGFALFMLEANLFKSQIVDYVKTSKQRDLKLDGDIELTYFPRLGLNFGKTTLSQKNSAQQFASVENARVYIAWWPLLFKQVEIERIVLDGMQAQITKYKNGSTDVDDLLVSDGSLSGVEFKIEKIRVMDAALILRDEKADLTLGLSELNLEAGKIAEKHPGDISASFRVLSDAPRINSKIKLAGHVIFDRSAKRFELANLETSLQGDFYRLSATAMDMKGSLIVDQANKQLELDKLVVTLTGLLDQQKIESRLDVASLKLDQNNQLSASTLVFKAIATHDRDSFALTLDVPDFAIKDGKLDATVVQGVFDLTQAGFNSQGKFSTPLIYGFESHQLQMSGLDASYSLAHPWLQTRLNASTTGIAQIGFDEQEMRLNFKAQLDESQFSGNLKIQDFSSPRFTLDVLANTLDFDRYFAIDWLKRMQEGAPLDWSALKTLNLRGKLRSTGEIRLGKIKAREFSTELRGDASGLNFDNLSARLYGGAMSGNLSLVPSEPPRVALKQKWTGVQFNTLLADFLGTEPWLMARGNLALDISSEGANPLVMRKALTGSANLQFMRGTLAGLNLGDALVSMRDQVGLKDAEHSVLAKKTDSTALTELKANIDFGQGLARSADMQLRGANFSSKGEAQLALDNGQFLFKGSVTVAPNLRRSVAGEIADLSGISIPLSASTKSEASSFSFALGEASGGNLARLLKTNQAKASPAIK